MSKIRNLSCRYCVAFSVAVVAIFFLIYYGIGELFNLLPKSDGLSLFEEVFDMLWPVALVFLFGYSFVFTKQGFMKNLKAGLPVLIFYLFLIANSFFVAASNSDTRWNNVQGILLGILSMIAVGIREELVFRGIIFNSMMLKYGKSVKGMWFSVIFSSLMFGLLHLGNFFAGGEVTGIIIQIVGAVSLGVLLTAIYLRGGNIWIPIIIHAAIDASGLFESTFLITELSQIDQINDLNYSGLFIIIPIQIGISVFLLRKSKRDDIFARFNSIREEKCISQ